MTDFIDLSEVSSDRLPHLLQEVLESLPADDRAVLALMANPSGPLGVLADAVQDSQLAWVTTVGGVATGVMSAGNGLAWRWGVEGFTSLERPTDA